MDGVVVVAGGSGSIGSAAAVRCLQLGARKVLITSSCDAHLQPVREELSEDAGGRLEGHVVDCANHDQVVKFRDEILAKYDVINHVISSVGYWEKFISSQAFTEQSVDDLEALFRSQCSSLFVLGKVFLPYLSTQPGSTFTMVSGTWGDMEEPPANCANLKLMFPISKAQNGISASLRQQYNVKDSHVTLCDVRVGVFVPSRRQASSMEGVAPEYVVQRAEVAELMCALIQARRQGVLSLTSRSAALDALAAYRGQRDRHTGGCDL